MRDPDDFFLNPIPEDEACRVALTLAAFERAIEEMRAISEETGLPIMATGKLYPSLDDQGRIVGIELMQGE